MYCLVFVLGILFGCLAGTAQPLVIGASVSLTGRFSTNGLAMLRGISLYADLVNAKGGLNVSGVLTPVDIRAIDDNSTEAGAAAATEALLASNVSIILSGFTSELAASQLNVLLQQPPSLQPLFLSGTASTTGMFMAYNNGFGVMPATRNRFGPVLQLLAHAGAKNVLFLCEIAAFAYDACSFDVSNLGLHRSVYSTYINATDADEALLALQSETPDVVVLGGFTSFVVKMLSLASNAGVNANAWVAISTVSDSLLATEPVVSSSNLIDVNAWDPRMSAVAMVPVDESCRVWSPIGCVTPGQLTNIYRGAFNASPNYDAAGLFAAGEVVGQAVQATGTTHLPTLRDMLRTTEFITSYGNVRFGVTTRQNSRPVVVRQVQGTAVVLLAPTESSTGQLVYPVPTWKQQACDSQTLCGVNGACTRDGTCFCSFGYVGSACQYGIAVPLFIVLGLVCVLCAIVAVVLMRRVQRMATAVRKSQEEARQKDILDEATRSIHARTLAYAAHELSNPLLCIVATLDDLKSGQPQKFCEELSAVELAAQQMRRVLTDLGHTAFLDSRSNAADVRRVPLEFVETDVRHLVRDISHRLDNLLAARLHCNVLPQVPSTAHLESLRTQQLVTHSVLACIAQQKVVNPSIRLTVTMTRVRQGTQPYAIGRPASFRDSNPPRGNPQFTLSGTVLASIAGRVPVEKRFSASASSEISDSEDGQSNSLHDIVFRIEVSEEQGSTPSKTGLVYETNPLDVTAPSSGADDTPLSVAAAPPLGRKRRNFLPSSTALGWQMDFDACSSLAKQLGGRLTVSNEAQRSVIEIYLPHDKAWIQPQGDASDGSKSTDHTMLKIEIPTEATTVSLGRDAEHSQLLGSCRTNATSPSRGAVLLVEDDRTNATLVGRMLSKMDFIVRHVEDGADLAPFSDAAMRECNDYTFILLDIVMPRSNGVDVLRSLRAAGCVRPIFAMTANTGSDDIALYEAEGFNGVLGKPFRASDLKQVVASVLGVAPLVSPSPSNHSLQ